MFIFLISFYKPVSAYVYYYIVRNQLSAAILILKN